MNMYRKMLGGMKQKIDSLKYGSSLIESVSDDIDEVKKLSNYLTNCAVILNELIKKSIEKENTTD